MAGEDHTLTNDLLILVSGLALIFLSHTKLETVAPAASKALEAIGFALAGYAPIDLIISARTRLTDRWTGRSIDRLFQSAVRIVSTKTDLPIIIAVDVEGCITPPRRTEVDLRKFQRFRAYCEWVKSEAGHQFPRLVIYTGRSQGYVELLAQSLGLIDSSFDLPFVIENGSALYFPASKRTIPLITREHEKMIQEMHHLLIERLPENEFEPKRYMITINAIPGRQTINELREKVTLTLQESDILRLVRVDSTASAVDIVVKDTNKLSGLKEVLKIYHNLRPDRADQGLDCIVALADGTSDIPVVEKVGQAFCPTHDVHPEIRILVEDRFGTDHVIDEAHIDFVITAIERVCGLRLI